MQKAGTGWYFNLANDLFIKAGFSDVREIKEKYRLHSILKHHNCNIGKLTKYKMSRVLIPCLVGKSFVVKTHESPTKSLRFFKKLFDIRFTYIYRDPRDVVVSAFEHGQRIRSEGKNHTFGKFETIEDTILFVNNLMKIYSGWKNFESVLIVRYEDLLLDTLNVLEELQNFLGLGVSKKELNEILKKYQLESLTKNQVDFLHFNKGKIGRYKKFLNKAS